ncbi:MAG: hypothetical protein ABJA75_19810, partial [Bradyrhizobium sp.]
RPAPGNRRRAFFLRRMIASKMFQFVESVSAHFPKFLNSSKKGLTRRANQRQNPIIARIAKPARRNPPRVFC